MASWPSPIALFGVALSFASLFGATAAQLVLPQAFFVASFDDKQSFIVSTDGQFLQGSLVIKQSITSSNKISIQLQSSGDIYSSGDLGTGTQLASFTYGSCTATPCVVPFSNLPVPAGSSWCAYIGFGATVSVDGVDSGIKAVFGFGQLPDTRCLFASAYNSQPASAIAKLSPLGDSGVSGYVSFQLADNSLVVSGRITNLAPSQNHGLHVHSFGDLRDTTTAMNTGGHLQLAATQLHALVSSPTRHSGDLGNIQADSNGVASFSIVVPQDLAADVALTLLAKSGNAIGRSIIVHAGADDGVTQPCTAHWQFWRQSGTRCHWVFASAKRQRCSRFDWRPGCILCRLDYQLDCHRLCDSPQRFESAHLRLTRFFLLHFCLDLCGSRQAPTASCR